MIISQQDIAHLSDTDIKMMVLAVLGTVDELDPGRQRRSGLSDFYLRLAVALMRARRERVAVLAEAESDAMNDDGPGGIVGPDDDPLADAAEELRRRSREEGLDWP